jgi:hypothetical protein
MNAATARLLDQLAMLGMGNGGDTQAHLHLEDRARGGYWPDTANLKPSGFYGREGVRVFIPPITEDRVVMFSDNSGVYIRADGFASIMGSDISHEVGEWEEVL